MKSSSLCHWCGLATAMLVAFTMLITPCGEVQAAEENPIERDLANYWSGKRKMPVIAGPQLYHTASRFELGVFGGIVPNDDFFTYYPLGARAAYSFNGIWGVELAGSWTGLSQNAELTDFLIEKGDGIRPEVDLDDRQLGRVGVLATFSPLYGKWSFQTYKISHFDLFFVLGAGAVFTEAPDIPEGEVDPLPDPKSRLAFEGTFGTGFRFFLSDWAALRIDARWYLYPAFDDGLKFPSEISLGFSFFTPEI